MHKDDILPLVIEPGFNLLPPVMRSIPAKAMLIAIGLQESRFTHRTQINGPARGYYQFEQGGGTRGVLTHPHTKRTSTGILVSLDYTTDIDICHEALAHNDALATVFARLLLWTHPDDLPGEQEHEVAWQQYLSTWRPGKPHRETWNAFYDQAWEMVS